MKRFLSMAALLMSCSTGVNASDSTTVYYETLSLDLSAGGVSANAASMTGFGISGTSSITEEVFISSAYTRLTGDIVGFASTMSGWQLGLGYTIHDDLNLKAGTGSQFRTGVGYYSTDIVTEISGTGYSESDNGTMIGVNYTLALGEAVSVDATVSGPLEDFEAQFGFGGSYKVGAGKIRLAYSSNEETINSVTLKASGYQLGYTFNY
jgi:hypothetical protein